jgi:hypothetical protein
MKSVVVRETYRLAQQRFHARGQAAWEAFRRTGLSSPADRVLARLQGKLETKLRQLRK